MPKFKHMQSALLIGLYMCFVGLARHFFGAEFWFKLNNVGLILCQNYAQNLQYSKKTTLSNIFGMLV